MPSAVTRRSLIALPFQMAALSLLGARPARAREGTLAPADRAFINRLTWGIDADTAERYAAGGREAFVMDQMLPGPALPPAAVQARVEAMTLSEMPAEALVHSLREDEKKIRETPEGEERDALRKTFNSRLSRLQNEAAERTLLRALHSPHQFQERLTWFWMNHFNLSIRKSGLSRALVPDFEERVIRPRVFGRFEDLLMATVRHPAMLIYLDNAQNRAGRINENYGRELLELHTLGVEGGYTQADVTALSRTLTGLGLNYAQGEAKVAEKHRAAYVREGLFEFHPARHDAADKTLLGEPVTGGGMDEVQAVMRRLARHPATARHLSRKLATWLVADAPPQALVDAMAGSYQESDGDLSDVLRTLLRHPAFQESLREEDFKDPMRYVLGGVRMLYAQADGPVVNAELLVQWLRSLDELPFWRDTPDGYPLRRTDWQGSGQMATRFDVAQRMAGGPPQLFHATKPPQGTKARVPEAGRALFDARLATNTRQATRAALGKARDPREWNTLWLASPDFMHA